MRHPEGAIKSILDLKEAVAPGAVFYMVFVVGEHKLRKYKLTVNENFKIVEDHSNCIIISDIIESYDGNHSDCRKFWSPHGDLHFPTGHNSCGYLFKNYWHAYAYELRFINDLQASS